MLVEIKKCPVCNKMYTGHPALSRRDNETYICPDCGTRESLDEFGLGESEIEHIIDDIHHANRGVIE